MRAMDGRIAIKTGADAVFVAIIPECKMGVAPKIADGHDACGGMRDCPYFDWFGCSGRTSPSCAKYRTPDITNWNGIICGGVKPADGFVV